MRKISMILLAVILLSVAVSAQSPFVADNAGLLTQTEAAQLERDFSEVFERYGFVMAAVTANSFDGKEPAAYAADCYAAGNYGNNGILLLLSEQEGQWYLYASGVCSAALSDGELEQIGQMLTEDLEAGRFYAALQTFRQQTLEPIRQELEERTAAAQKLQAVREKYILLGMAGGLVVGILVAVYLGKVAKRPRKTQNSLTSE